MAGVTSMTQYEPHYPVRVAFPPKDIRECLGEVLWRAERSGQAPDGAAYLDCLARRAR
jgi:bisphosphoglycerate-independent phosphoglycerate mutase (AlkP superfamily)